MELKTGYKQTEVGVIPSDWKVKKIREVCKLVNGRGFKPFEWKNEGLPIIRIQNLNGSDDFNYFLGQYDKKLEVENGQLLFAWSGSRGTSFGPHIWNGSKGLLNYHTWKIIVNENEIVKSFFTHALKNLTKSIEDKAHGASALVHTQKWEMEGFDFPLPFEKSEQTAIATALSDIDQYITHLEKLIAKKRNIKQGATQELLKPKEGWVVKKLGEIGIVIRGASPRPQGDTRFYGGTVPRLMVEDVTRDGKFVTPKVDFLTEEGAKRSRPCKAGTLTIVCSGTVGIPSILAVDACIHDGFLALVKIKREYSSDYLYHQLIVLREKFEQSATHGGVFTNLTTSILKEFEITFPSENEQTRIATILSDMDAEITILETKLSKAQSIKQGMMQQLLTGKIRLI